MPTPPWIWPLVGTLFMQVVVALMVQAPWVIGPVLTAAAGVAPERIGDLSALNALGSMLFFVAGAPWLAHYGAIRMLQWGALVGAAGIAFLVLPVWPVMMAAAFVVGFGYGPIAPGGSAVLARFAPARHKGMIFSIKQAGAPLGGALGGAVLPAVALGFGWRWAVVLVALLGIAAALAVRPLRAVVDGPPPAEAPPSLVGLLAWRSLRRPFEALRLSPSLPAVTVAGIMFAVIHGNLTAFTVTYLTAEVGMPIAAAGGAFAAMQVAGVFGRVVIGWISDRTGSIVRTLAVLSVTATVMTLVVATIGPEWPFATVVAVMIVVGFSAATWNGIHLAEVARLAPDGRVGDVTAASVLFLFVGYAAGPALFTQMVGWSGAYAPAFVATGSLGVIAGAALLVALARQRAHADRP